MNNTATKYFSSCRTQNRQIHSISAKNCIQEQKTWPGDVPLVCQHPHPPHPHTFTQDIERWHQMNQHDHSANDRFRVTYTYINRHACMSTVLTKCLSLVNELTLYVPLNFLWPLNFDPTWYRIQIVLGIYPNILEYEWCYIAHRQKWHQSAELRVVSQKLFNKHFVAPCTHCTPPQETTAGPPACLSVCHSTSMYMYVCSPRCWDCRHKWSSESHLSLMDPRFLSVEAGEGSQSPSLTALQQLMQDQTEQMVKEAEAVT